jgi:hypothetical protein
VSSNSVPSAVPPAMHQRRILQYESGFLEYNIGRLPAR